MNSTIKVWTLQSYSVYNELLKNGVFHCDYSKSPNQEPCFHDAYDWLVGKMKEKIGDPPEGVSYPIWAWYMYEGRNQLDLRKVRGRNEVLVSIELELPLRDVVLSEFDDWHHVLNKMYLDITSLTSEEWNHQQDIYNQLPPEKKDEIMRESWNNIFNTTPFENDWMSRGLYVQATFWELKLDQVKHARFVKPIQGKIRE